LLIAEQVFSGVAVDDRDYFVGFSAVGAGGRGGFVLVFVGVAVVVAGVVSVSLSSRLLLPGASAAVAAAVVVIVAFRANSSMVRQFGL
jgi:hypothetical protein